MCIDIIYRIKYSTLWHMPKIPPKYVDKRINTYYPDFKKKLLSHFLTLLVYIHIVKGIIVLHKVNGNLNLIHAVR